MTIEFRCGLIAAAALLLLSPVASLTADEIDAASLAEARAVQEKASASSALRVAM